MNRLNENNPKSLGSIRVPVLNRRRFIKRFAFFSFISLLPFWACKRLRKTDERRPSKIHLSKKEKEILMAVQEHMLPREGAGPGARDIYALGFFEFILSDKHLPQRKRKLLLSGIRWTEETAKTMYNTTFPNLKDDYREDVLRDLETYKNGKKWLSEILGYLFEALLGAPAYGINTNQTGWKWLDHSPGFPQPESDFIYGTYGYGI
jgi:gluconate 2-dehydrogenase gamma chain